MRKERAGLWKFDKYLTDMLEYWVDCYQGGRIKRETCRCILTILTGLAAVLTALNFFPDHVVQHSGTLTVLTVATVLSGVDQGSDQPRV